MARPRKGSLGERIRQKRLSSLPPRETARAGAPGPVHVAPLAPPPSFAEAAPIEDTAPVEDTAPIEDTAPESGHGAPHEADPSIAPISAALYGPAVSRRWIAVVAGIATVIGIMVGIGITRSRARSRSPAAAAPAPSVQKAVTVHEPPPTPAPPPPPPEPSTEPAASATAAPTASADAVSATTLRDQALALLEKAKNPEAMAAARAAMDADPTDAMPYLVLGSALQDAGRWREANRTYELCVKTATKGMIDECRAMLRRR